MVQYDSYTDIEEEPLFAKFVADKLGIDKVSDVDPLDREALFYAFKYRMKKYNDSDKEYVLSVLKRYEHKEDVNEYSLKRFGKSYEELDDEEKILAVFCLDACKQRVMFYTKDNKVFVTNMDFSDYHEKSRREELNRLQEYFAQYNYDEICINYRNRGMKPASERNILSLIDDKNSDFINEYVRGFFYIKDRAAYKNIVEKNNFPPAVKKPNTLHFDNSVDDSTVPEFIKNLGFQIVPQEVCVSVNVDDPEFDKKFEEQMVRMDVSSDERIVRIHRYHYTFPPADYTRLRRLITTYEALSPKPDVKKYIATIGNPRERRLFNIYAKEKKFEQNRENFIHHEFHHVKNRMVFYAMFCKPNAKRLTPENTYRLEVENERSAYLSQTIKAINTYLMGGNFDDYSAFDNYSKGLINEIKDLTDAQKVAYLTNMDKVVNWSMKHFKESKREFYDENLFKDRTDSAGRKIFGTVTKYMLLQPMDVPEDLSGEQYNLMRSAYYSIAVYNPATGKMETRNLSKHIKPENEVQINSEQMANIVNPAKSKLEEKLEAYRNDSQKSGIDPNLLDEARVFYCRQMRSPRIISDAQTINVADLVEGRTRFGWHDLSPTPTPVPDDRAAWSDSLKNYWSRFDGYNEIAKNNFEYSFAIDNQKISYKSKDSVLLDKSCKYEMYERLIKIPADAKKAVRFESSLSEDQALMLYVACVNNGRKMRGAIPTDLSMIETMEIIPQSERDKFKALTTPKSKDPITTSRVITSRSISR